MRTSTVVILIVVLMLAAAGAVAAYLLLKGESKTSFNLGDGSVVGAKIEFHNLVLNHKGNSLTLTGTYDNNSKGKGSVYLTVQAISKSTEQSITFKIPVVAGSGKSFTQKKTSSIELESAALGSLFFQGTGSFEESTDSSGTNGGTYPWESESGGSSTVPIPESSSTTNDGFPDSGTLPGSGSTIPGMETSPSAL